MLKIRKEKTEKEVLIVTRDWKSAYNQTSILTNNKGKVVAIFNRSTNQPQKKDKTIFVRGKEYVLKFPQKK